MSALVAAGTVRAEPMAPHPYRVVAKEPETPDTFTLGLERVDGPPMPFSAGQFVMVYVFGVGEVPISISGNPIAPNTLALTVRGVGAVTNAIVGLRAGEVAGIRGPYGVGWPLSAAADTDLLVIGGGIGLAPLRPALFSALTSSQQYRSISLIYGARSPGDLLFKDDLLGWVSSPLVSVEVTVDRAQAEWWGDVGLVTALVPRVDFAPEATTALMCGPEIMMRVVARELEGRGVSPEAIWMSMERNMKCGIGLCGHCQYGRDLLCRTGPVNSFAEYRDRLMVAEL